MDGSEFTVLTPAALSFTVNDGSRFENRGISIQRVGLNVFLWVYSLAVRIESRYYLKELENEREMVSILLLPHLFYAILGLVRCFDSLEK